MCARVFVQKEGDVIRQHNILWSLSAHRATNNTQPQRNATSSATSHFVLRLVIVKSWTTVLLVNSPTVAFVFHVSSVRIRTHAALTSPRVRAREYILYVNKNIIMLREIMISWRWLWR